MPRNPLLQKADWLIFHHENRSLSNTVNGLKKNDELPENIHPSFFFGANHERQEIRSHPCLRRP